MGWCSSARATDGRNPRPGDEAHRPDAMTYAVASSGCDGDGRLPHRFELRSANEAAHPAMVSAVNILTADKGGDVLDGR